MEPLIQNPDVTVPVPLADIGKLMQGLHDVRVEVEMLRDGTDAKTELMCSDIKQTAAVVGRITEVVTEHHGTLGKIETKVDEFANSLAGFANSISQVAISSNIEGLACEWSPKIVPKPKPKRVQDKVRALYIDHPEWLELVALARAGDETESQAFARIVRDLVRKRGSRQRGTHFDDIRIPEMTPDEWAVEARCDRQARIYYRKSRLLF